MKKIKHILITGAAGLCGSVVFDGLKKKGYKICGYAATSKSTTSPNSFNAIK